MDEQNETGVVLEAAALTDEEVDAAAERMDVLGMLEDERATDEVVDDDFRAVDDEVFEDVLDVFEEDVELVFCDGS